MLQVVTETAKITVISSNRKWFCHTAIAEYTAYGVCNGWLTLHIYGLKPRHILPFAGAGSGSEGSGSLVNAVY